jgi:hypothetical protein
MQSARDARQEEKISEACDPQTGGQSRRIDGRTRYLIWVAARARRRSTSIGWTNSSNSYAKIAMQYGISQRFVWRIACEASPKIKLNRMIKAMRDRIAAMLQKCLQPSDAKRLTPIVAVVAKAVRVRKPLAKRKYKTKRYVTHKDKQEFVRCPTCNAKVKLPCLRCSPELFI